MCHNSSLLNLSEYEKRLRRRNTLALVASGLIFAIFLFAGMFISGDMLPVDFARKNLPPSWIHPFGCDGAGRDMFLRSVKGLSTSILIALLAVLLSVLIALVTSYIQASSSKVAKKIVDSLVDLFLSIPQMMLLIFVSVVVGRGVMGVVFGIAFTHWMHLSRILSAEVKQVMEEPYIACSRAFGKSHGYIYIHHVLPHLGRQLLVSLGVLFPHAILDEAAISFLGLGLPLEMPAIGTILAESMQYLLQGNWWLAVYPGLMLVFLVVDMQIFARALQKYFGAEGDGLNA